MAETEYNINRLIFNDNFAVNMALAPNLYFSFNHITKEVLHAHSDAAFIAWIINELTESILVLNVDYTLLQNQQTKFIILLTQNAVDFFILKYNTYYA